MSARRRASGLWILPLLALSGCASQTKQVSALPEPCGAARGAFALGCANEANLAAMVADPADLRRGRELTPGSAVRAAQAIEAYQAPQPLREPAPEPMTETTR
jgi:type IV pilus biogenesis protein CpaD/CtpE